MLWVNGYSTLPSCDSINQKTARKVRRLLADNKVGYIVDDSFGCQLACKKEHYVEICKYLGVKIEPTSYQEEFSYLFDDIRICIQDGFDHGNVSEKAINVVVEQILNNLDKYQEIILSAREWRENDEEFWTIKLWNKAILDI